MILQRLSGRERLSITRTHTRAHTNWCNDKTRLWDLDDMLCVRSITRRFKATQRRRKTNNNIYKLWRQHVVREDEIIRIVTATPNDCCCHVSLLFTERCLSRQTCSSPQLFWWWNTSLRSEMTRRCGVTIALHSSVWINKGAEEKGLCCGSVVWKGWNWWNRCDSPVCVKVMKVEWISELNWYERWKNRVVMWRFKSC